MPRESGASSSQGRPCGYWIAGDDERDAADRTKKRLALRVDARFQDRRWLEDQHTARRDLHLPTGLRVATQALASLADDEGPERGQSHRLAALKALRDRP